MKFDFSKYKGKYVMHCKTEEEAEDFCRVMHEAGLRWSSGYRYDKETNFYPPRRDHCYNFNEGLFGGITIYIHDGFTILEWEDFMEKQFTKADLKDGMVGVTREGNKYVWLCNMFRNQNGDNALCDAKNMNDDLTHKFLSELDIAKVYISKSNGLSKWFDDNNLELVWTRPEGITEMTVSEIKEALGISGALKIKEG